MSLVTPLQHHLRTLGEIDREIFLQFQRIRFPALARLLDRVMITFTRLGDWQTWTLLGLAGFVLSDGLRMLVLDTSPRILGAFVFCRVLKKFLNRARPSVTVPGFTPLLKDPDPYSFPSAHSACAWSVAIALSLNPLTQAGGPLWLLYASAISVSRLLVGAHYPGDVLAGILIGAVAGWI